MKRKIKNINESLHSINEEVANLKSDHIGRILSESVDLGKGGRAKNLKAYVRFFSEDFSSFMAYIKEKCNKINEENNREYQCTLNNSVFYFDVWDWGILVYHTMDEEGTNEIEKFLRTQPVLRKPWIDKKGFEELCNEFAKQGGQIVSERCDFRPYNDYSGYDMTLEVRGERTDEVIKRMKKEYVLHPRKIGFEFRDGNNGYMKFEMFNNGRISFSSGEPNSMVVIIARYANFIKENDKKYDYRQSKRIIEDSFSLRQTFEIISLNLPSLKRIGVSREIRDKAILEMLTAGGGLYGYIGMPISTNRASIVNLKEHKMLQITIDDDKLLVYSENPSVAQSAIRALMSHIACHIDPEVTMEKIEIGD